MRRRLIYLSLICFCLSGSSFGQSNLDIRLSHNTRGEQQTRDQLQRLLGEYDLTPNTFTRSIVIDETAIPHSHPVLTLHTRHLKDDELLLSTFVHEQAHWWTSAQNNFAAMNSALSELRSMFPKVPVGAPEGAANEDSNYLHLVVVYLEYRGIRELIGELKARHVMEFWSTDHYTWIYKTVLERSRDIGNILAKHQLIPPRQP